MQQTAPLQPAPGSRHLLPSHVLAALPLPPEDAARAAEPPRSPTRYVLLHGGRGIGRIALVGRHATLVDASAAAGRSTGWTPMRLCDTGEAINWRFVGHTRALREDER
jgi:hypothetical protein